LDAELTACGCKLRKLRRGHRQRVASAAPYRGKIDYALSYSLKLLRCALNCLFYSREVILKVYRELSRRNASGSSGDRKRLQRTRSLVYPLPDRLPVLACLLHGDRLFLPCDLRHIG